MTAIERDDLISAAAPEPLWQQAAAAISHEIESGALAPGSKLPSERELTEHFGMSRVTLRKALAHLYSLGALTSSQGRGWFVTSPTPAEDWPNTLESFSETARRKGMKATSRVLRAEAAPATLDEADRLGVAGGSQLFHLERVRLLDAVPVAVDLSVFPLAIVPDAAAHDFARASLYEVLGAAGVSLDRSETSIEAQAADAETARHLELEPGRPVLVLDQLTFSAAARPVLISTVRYSGERYRLRTVFQRGAR